MKAKSSITVRYIPAPVPGPVFYPAGVWAALSTYERTSSACPFVLYDTGNPATDLYYYVAKDIKIVGNVANVNPKSDYAVNGANATWKPLENIGYVFANLIMANFGLIAGAVFSNNKLFSQFGKLAGSDSTEYQKLKTNPDGTVDPSGFVPNVLIDWMRGYASILKGDLGPFKIDKYELANSDYNAGISMRSQDGSYVKVGNSAISFFDNAKVAIQDLTGSNSGLFVNVKKAPANRLSVYDDYNNASNIIGQSIMGGRDFSEYTNIYGNSNTPQLLTSFWINYNSVSGIGSNRSMLWWDTKIYSFVSPINSVKRLSQGVYQFAHNLFRLPVAGSPVDPRKHVTNIFVKAYPAFGGSGASLYATFSAPNDSAFIIQTGDDASANDISNMMIEVYNITYQKEFAKIVNS